MCVNVAALVVDAEQEVTLVGRGDQLVASFGADVHGFGGDYVLAGSKRLDADGRVQPTRGHHQYDIRIAPPQGVFEGCTPDAAHFLAYLAGQVLVEIDDHAQFRPFGLGHLPGAIAPHAQPYNSKSDHFIAP